MSLILNAVFFGLILSFLLGPAFFALLETSIKKGFRSALFFDIGLIISDSIYLFASLFVAEKINSWLSSHPYIKYIAGSIFVILGLISIIKNYYQINKEKERLQEFPEIDSKNTNIIVYPFQLIIKGMGLNAINPGVLVFWIAACTFATEELNIQGNSLFYYFGITLLTMFAIDILKIYFSSKLKENLTNKAISVIGIIIGAIMVFFGIAIYFKDFQV